MSGSEVAALIVAITGALGAIFAGVRNLRGDKIKSEVAAAAAVLSGYTTLASDLRLELERNKVDHAADRKQWAQDRLDMKAEHVQEVKDLRDEHRSEMLIAYERIDELGSLIYVMQNRPPNAQERKDDKP